MQEAIGKCCAPAAKGFYIRNASLTTLPPHESPLAKSLTIKEPLYQCEGEVGAGGIFPAMTL